MEGNQPAGELERQDDEPATDAPDLRVIGIGASSGGLQLLYEHASTLAQPPSIQIFATDIDEEAIATARQGLYPETIAADVSPERLQRFFVLEQEHYRIKREIRDLLLFAPHNLLRDPPFSKLDLITCRNLLIYLNRGVQEQILQLFHFILRSEGVLLLGASESTDGVPSLFTPIDKNQRLYRTRVVPTTTALYVPSVPLVGPPLLLATSPGRAPAESATRSFADLHTNILRQFTPPSVIVNEHYEIVHLSHGTGGFLQFNEGEPSHNLLKVVHADMRLELRTALFAASQHGRRETRRVRVERENTIRLIDLTVQPIGEPEWARGYFLVVFDDFAEASEFERKMPQDPEPLVAQLDEELQRTKDQLRLTIEQYETAVEEYKAANEELQAINEELRAATEELETSNEELQSVNEELATVNQELKHKVDEVSHSNNDLQNLMASTEIGTIFVERELRIKRYTPSAQALFNLIAGDINRPLAHVTHKLDYGELSTDAQHVLRTLAKVEREERSEEWGDYLARLQPYRTVDDRIDGVIPTFVDITERGEAVQTLAEREEDMHQLLASVRDYAIVVLNEQGQISRWNVGAMSMFGYSESEAVGQPFAMLYTPEDRAAGAPEDELHRALANGRADDERWHMRKDGSRFYVSGVLSAIRNLDQLQLVKVMRDLTEDQQAQQALREAHDMLEQRVAQRTEELATSNQQLRAKIAMGEKIEADRAQLLREIVATQEQERRRIARELHDQLGQQISALRLGLGALANGADQDVPRSVGRLQQIIAQLDREIDRLAFELRPVALDDLGLLNALQHYVEEWAERASIAAEFQPIGLDGERLPNDIETTVYRVVQEALTNVLKHAAAAHVSVIVERRDAEVRAVVEDDGQGFDVEAQQAARQFHELGLIGMQERAVLVGGWVTIESEPGRGTTVFVRIPLQNPEEQPHDN
jgi:two-component system CheB/CheR fusion protein